VADKPIGPGTVLAGRFRLEDLLQETSGAKFWRATDRTLARNVAVHVIESGDPRSNALLVAARTSATVSDGHFLRVLDAAEEDGVVYVVNEWGSGVSLDRLLEEGPLHPRRAAWVVKEVGEAVSAAHRQGIAHGRLLPENVMVTEAGSVKLIGFVIDSVLHGRSVLRGPRRAVLSDRESDVVNLAALLYAGLVGRWPGSEGSVVPDAPNEHGRVMRPRQVRAGVPRQLDAICDRALNGGSTPHSMPIGSAHEICAALSDYIGDPTASTPLGYESPSVMGSEPLSGPEEPPVERTADQSAAGPGPGLAGAAYAGATTGGSTEPDPLTGTGAGTADDPDATRAVRPSTGQHSYADEPTRRAETADPDATQAGTPVFYDDDSGVGWGASGEHGPLGATAHRSPPPPPPDLPEPEPKPLFAPDPPGGGHTGWGQAPEPEPGPSHRAGSGTGSLPLVWGPDARDADDGDSEDWERRDVGMTWLRLGGVVALCLLMLVAVVVAFNLGRGSDNTDTASGDNNTPSGTPSSARNSLVPIAGVDDFDPQGDQEENPELAPLAIDGNPSTAWHTLTYYNDPHLGRLKPGVGLVADLGKPTRVADVHVALLGQPTSLQILAAPGQQSEPTSTSGLRTVASAQGVGSTADLKLKRPVQTRYLVVWLTSLPPSSGGYVGQIAEITVRS
jgi:hypothetical protein